jgi:hypothetical protein
MPLTEGADSGSPELDSLLQDSGTQLNITKTLPYFQCLIDMLRLSPPPAHVAEQECHDHRTYSRRSPESKHVYLTMATVGESMREEVVRRIEWESDGRCREVGLRIRRGDLTVDEHGW